MPKQVFVAKPLLLDYAQHEEAERTRRWLNDWRDVFVKAAPKKK